MQNQSYFTLILSFECFLIPSHFDLLDDINPEILKILKSKQKYEIKSKVNLSNLISFIEYWVYKKNIFLLQNNILQLELLSQEFDFMKNLIQLYKNKSINKEISPKYSHNTTLKNIYQNKKDILAKKRKDYQQIIYYLFNNNGITNQSDFLNVKKELFEAIINRNIQLVDYLTQKKVICNGLVFLLNEKANEASLFRNMAVKNDVFIPKSVSFESKKFIVSEILEKSFKNSKGIKSIHFPNDSKLRTIKQEAFYGSSLEEIEIPSHVTQIGQNAFFLCNTIKSVFFHEDSKLRFFGKFMFVLSSIESIVIPPSVEEIEDGWCRGMNKLRNIKIMPNNKHFKLYEEKFLLRKSNDKSDEFDVLMFARRDIEEVIIPSFIKIISSYAFEQCNQIKKYNIFDRIKTPKNK